MRILVVLILVLNVGLFAFGRGYFGVPPSEAGRSLSRLPPINAGKVTLGEPVLAAHQAR